MTSGRPLRMGIIVDPQRFIPDKFVCAATKPLVEALMKRYECELTVIGTIAAPGSDKCAVRVKFLDTVIIGIGHIERSVRGYGDAFRAAKLTVT